jgi:4-azaleucine resistance transporter AzlC
VSTTRILYWCGAYNGLFAIVGNLLLQKWGISFATLAYFILQHIMVEFNTKGLDFVLTALFVVIFLSHWSAEKNRKPALIGVLSSVVCLLIFGPEGFIIPAMITILVVLTVSRRKLVEGE